MVFHFTIVTLDVFFHGQMVVYFILLKRLVNIDMERSEIKNWLILSHFIISDM